MLFKKLEKGRERVKKIALIVFAGVGLVLSLDSEGAYETTLSLGEEIIKIARQGLESDNPIAYQIIDNFSWEIEDIQEVMLSLQDNMSPNAAARNWIGNNPDKVAEWTARVSAE